MSGQPTRRARRSVLQRLVVIGNVFAIVGFLAAAGLLAYSYDKFGQIPRVEIAEFLSESGDVAADGEAENFLLVGVDSAEGLDPDDPVRSTRAEITGLRSDTVMILRVDPASSRAALLSIPRDLYVPIAGTGREDKINEAIQIGGPQGLITTIQDYFGIPINHYVQVDFFGFGQLVDALNGVPIYFPHPVRDLNSGLNVPEAGCVTLDPKNALGFVRARAYQEFIDGRWRIDGSGDLGRIQRQQVFIVESLARAFERGLRNPVTLDALIDSGLDAVTVDDTLDGQGIIDLVSQFRKFRPEALDMYELPVVDDTVGGADILRLQSREAEPVLDVFRDRDPGAATESAVRVQVLNGTGSPGQASSASEDLRTAGFSIAGTADADDLGTPRTEIHHPPDDQPGADLLARWLSNGARLVEDPDVETVTLVTGDDYEGTRAQPEPSDTTASTPTTLPRASTTTTPTDSSTTVLGTVPVEIPDHIDCG